VTGSQPHPLDPALAAMAASLSRDGIPRLDVRIALPDLAPWLEGNVMRGVWSFAGTEPGPHLLVVAATHGNEIAGALVLERWLRLGLRPARGRLTLAFANLDALCRFDPGDPTASRFLDEDMNRIWEPETLASGRRSAELRRARALLPVIEQADVLFDLHSMLWPSDPLLLVGQSREAATLAMQVGVPPLVIADQGHLGGRRLIDYPPLLSHGRRAFLIEAGSHWELGTVATMEVAAARLMRVLGLATADDPVLLPLPLPETSAPVRFAEVTDTITARTPGFAFMRPFRGGEVVAARNTLIALDGEREIRTPHDDCMLVMPGLRSMPGHTAVRLARFAQPPAD
jgi:predicted deacylase